MQTSHIIFAKNSQLMFLDCTLSTFQRWTSNVCDQDSDDDGITNGEELGDPYCEWKRGIKPRRTTNITHPGMTVHA